MKTLLSHPFASALMLVLGSCLAAACHELKISEEPLQLGDAGAGAGAPGTDTNREESAGSPECTFSFSESAGYTPIGVSSVRSASAALIGDRTQFQLYAIKPTTRTLVMKWSQADAEKRAWLGNWICFDTVPDAERIVGSNLRNGRPEVFVITANGSVFARREYDADWGIWLPFNLPSSQSFVTDLTVVTASGTRDHVYIVDRGRIFVRYRTNDSDAFAPYGTWIDLGMSARSISAGVFADKRQQLFALDAQGIPQIAAQSEAKLGAAFGPWQDFSTPELPPLTHIERGEASSGEPLVLGVANTGELWTRTLSNGLEWSTWQKWNGPSLAGKKLVSTSSARVTETRPSLLLSVLTDTGNLYISILEGDTWSAWVDAL